MRAATTVTSTGEGGEANLLDWEDTPKPVNSPDASSRPAGGNFFEFLDFFISSFFVELLAFFAEYRNLVEIVWYYECIFWIMC